MNYDAVIVRRAVDDFWALLTSSAMQSLGGVEVISITYSYSPDNDSKNWHIFAKYASGIVSTEQIDAAIDLAYEAK